MLAVQQRGFGLIEILVALAVMATGLLAVAGFQSDLLSNSDINKARGEALGLAQARIEDFRNYSNDVTTEAAFETAFATTNGYVTETTTDQDGNTVTATIYGTNANFARSYSISGATGAPKTVLVTVSWTDKRGTAQNVSLSTQVGWESPRSVADITNTEKQPIVPSATGRARLGEGTVPNNVTPSTNSDGTQVFDNGDEVKLVVGSDIVLTLEDACQSLGNCIDFVKISGRIYIDVTTHNQLEPGDVYVKASDAAYCHRYYYTGAVDGDGNPVVAAVTSSTTKSSTPNTANGNYEYFEYTCYLGGGWHGNIGILFAGGISQDDKVCLGDPTSSDNYADPVISSRRVYRGMLYAHDGSGGKVMITKTDSNGVTNTQVRYYSIGIKDQTVFPATGQPGHDFVIAKLQPGDTTGDKCGYNVTTPTPAQFVGPMTRTDSNDGGTLGDLFAGTPTNFVCLNPSNVDSFVSSIYGVENSCPYDPSDPPVLRYTIAGTATIDGNTDISSYVSAITMNTSDGEGNCTLDTFAYNATDTEYTAAYTCDYYAWTEANGWTGYVELKPNTDEISCDALRNSYSGIHVNQTSQSFYCSAGEFILIKGDVTLTASNKPLQSATMTGSTGFVDGVCTISTTGTTSHYECRTNTLTTEDWTGTIVFVSDNGTEVCYPPYTESATVTATYSNYDPGTYTYNFKTTSGNDPCP